MKQLFFISMCCITTLCAGQQNKSSIDFMKLVSPQYVSIANCHISSDGGDTIISYFFYESSSTIKNGGICFFAIPQKEFGVWKVEYPSGLKREERFKNTQEKIKNAKEFLTRSKDSLCLYFDLYAFYVKPIDVIEDGSAVEDDGRVVPDYHIKDNAVVYIYKYDCKNNMWININEKNINGQGIRNFGQDFLEKILRKRFGNP